MSDFLDELRNGLKQCDICDSRLLVAVSGGADSVALLRGLVDLRSEFSLELFVAHLNHRLRGVDSDADARWVCELAASLNLPSEIGEIPEGILTANASGLEEQARRLRYEFLEISAAKFDCPAIALAHTASDQAETVLHHLFRGTGIAGLTGIPPVRLTTSGLRLVRPILGLNRTLVEGFLCERGQTYCTDHSNSDTAMTRNKLRHVILPLLRKQINPQVDAALCRLAEQAMEIDEVLHHAASQLLAQCLMDQQPGLCHLDIRLLAGQPRHLIREMFCQLWQRQGWPRQAMGFAHWNRLADMLFTRKSVDFPNGVEARFHSDRLLVIRRI
ncbi:MAG: tRNA lysidine(34) synthetase TilS [Schlesneria sp.]